MLKINKNECYENNCCDLNRIKNMKLKKIYDRMKVMVIMQQPLYNEIK